MLENIKTLTSKALACSNPDQVLDQLISITELASDVDIERDGFDAAQESMRMVFQVEAHLSRIDQDFK